MRIQRGRALETTGGFFTAHTQNWEIYRQARGVSKRRTMQSQTDLWFELLQCTGSLTDLVRVMYVRTHSSRRSSFMHLER